MSPKNPFLFDLSDLDPARPDSAPPLPDDPPPPDGQAMQQALRAGRMRLSRWAKLGWAALIGFVTLALSVTAWDFVTGLLSRNPWLGWLAAGLLGLLVLAALLLALREWAGFRRLRRIEALREAAASALQDDDRARAARLCTDLAALYAARPEMRWPRERLTEILADQPDADGLLGVTETTLMDPLDQQARAEVEAAARQVALLTAMIPLALVDVLAALVTNLRMIRRIAEIYGGRAGALGSLRLLRGVIAHLLATGAVAVGEDMIGSVASGGMLSKLSRRFGEGVVNGALTARLGIAAMEICRPLPFAALPRPRTSAVMRRAVSGLFDRAG